MTTHYVVGAWVETCVAIITEVATTVLAIPTLLINEWYDDDGDGGDDGGGV